MRSLEPKRSVKDGPAWALYVEQMAAEGVTVVYSVKTPDHFYKQAKRPRKGKRQGEQR